METDDQMFRDGNRLRFEREVDVDGRRWWREAFLGPHGLTPEGMADLLTASVTGEKAAVYRSFAFDPESRRLARAYIEEADRGR